MNPDDIVPEGARSFFQSLVTADSDTLRAASRRTYEAAPADSLALLNNRERGVMSTVGRYAKEGARGLVRGYDQFGRLIASAGEWAGNKLGADEDGQVMRDLRMIQRDGMVTARAMEDLLGPEEHGTLPGIVRGIGQFAFGWQATGYGKVLKPVTRVGKYALAAARGAAVDAGFFDPREDRLSNMAVNAPGVIGEAARALAANPDDSEAVARMKAATEGIVMGAAFDSFISVAKHSPRAVRAMWREARTRGAEVMREFGIKPKRPAAAAATEAAAEATEGGAAKAAAEEEWFDVVEDAATGDSKIVSKDGTVEIPLDNPDRARAVAASLNFAEKNKRLPRTSITAEQADRLRAAARKIAEDGNARDIQESLSLGHDINLPYDLSSDEAQSLISAISTTIREPVLEGRFPAELKRGVDGRRVTNAETVAKAAQDHGGKTPGQMLGVMDDLAAAQAEIPATVTAARILRANVAEQASKLARQMELDKHNSVAHAEYLKAVNTLVHVFVAERRLLSGAGRALQAAQIKTGPHGAKVDAGDLAKALGKGEVDPLDVIHFELVDDAVDDSVLKQLDPDKLDNGAAHSGNGNGASPDAPNPHVADAEAASKEVKKARAAKPRKKAEPKPNGTSETDKLARKAKDKSATDGLTVREWSRARAVERALNVLRKAAGSDAAAELDPIIEALGATKRTADVLRKSAMKVPDVPADAAEKAAAARGNGGNPVKRLSEWFDKAEAELDKFLDPVDEAPKPKAEKAPDPVGAFIRENKNPDDPVARISRLLDKSDKALDKFMAEGPPQPKPKGQPRNPGVKEASPNVVDKHRTAKPPKVHLTKRQARALARKLSYFPKNAEERDAMLKSLLTTARQSADNGSVPASKWQRLWDGMVGYRRWAMLSAPTSAEVNFVSNLAHALYRPVEGMIGSALSLNKDQSKQYFDLMVGQLRSVGDALHAANRAFMEGAESLEHSVADMPQFRPMNDSSLAGRILNFGRVTERVMMWGDELVKHMTYRGHVYAQSMSAARGLNLSADELRQRVADDIAAAFSDGIATNPNALSYAQDITFRTKLDAYSDKTIGHRLEQMARDIPFVRVLLPFTRVPVNIARWNLDRMPGVGMLTSRNRVDWAAGGSQQAEALGRQAVGAALWLGAGMAYSAGMVTGGGPKDPELRKQWLNVYQPYSIRVGDQWISYRRLEPMATPIGIVADFLDMVGEIEDDEPLMQVFGGFLAGVAQNLTSKTYMRGISDFFYAVTSGERSGMDQFVSGVAGSFVPNVMVRMDGDDYMRQTRTFTDRLQQRIPGFSDNLEPRRNIYGEKVLKPGSWFQRAFNPFTVADARADDVDVELLRIGAQINMPNPVKMGIDLSDRDKYPVGVNRQSAYDRWLELHSEPLMDGMTLRDKLREVVKSEEYQQRTEAGRLLLVDRYVKGFRQLAFGRLIQENRKLLEAIQAEAIMRGASLVDDPDLAEGLRATAGASSAAQAFGL